MARSRTGIDLGNVHTVVIGNALRIYLKMFDRGDGSVRGDAVTILDSWDEY